MRITSDVAANLDTLPNMTLYNKIGKNYNINRTADIRISKRILELLQIEKPCEVVEIGAGTGNYAYELANIGIKVHAIEPSDIMLEQKREHPNILWHKGTAEKLHLNLSGYDGVYIVLAIHHFKSIQKAFEEIYRILKPNKNLVIYSSDPRLVEGNCWLKDYFGLLIDNVESSYPALKYVKAELEKIFKTEASVSPFNIPFDMKDGFFFSGWQKPEKYLNSDYRKNISVFAKADEEMVMNIIKRLKEDLENGVWDEKYQGVRNLKELNGGYYFLRIKK